MAKMFPDKLPVVILNDERRSAEVQVYDALKGCLNDEYHVFYSSPWLGTNPDGSEKDGEADFTIVHAEKGLLVIEVKGGRVRINDQNQWMSKDRYGVERGIKNPVEQARTGKHNILNRLKESPLWNSRYIWICHGVILPHVEKYSRDFRPDMPLKIFAFDEDMVDLTDWIESRYSTPDEDCDYPVKPLGEDGIHALDRLIRGEIVFRVRLRSMVSQDVREIELKSTEQIDTLRELEDNKRMAISGAAGTGKTILAMEKAAQLSASGLSVLLLCYNKPLGLYLSEQLREYPGIRVSSYHGFCREIAVSAGKSMEVGSPEAWSVDLIENFADCGEEEFDALIVDEGQDFEDGWLDNLESVVKQGNEGVLYIFYDDNQNVKNANIRYIQNLPYAKHWLFRNYRNTREIFELSRYYYKGRSVICRGPSGKAPEYHTCHSIQEAKSRLSERIGDLVKNEGIHEEEIAVLLPTEKEVSEFRYRKNYRVGTFEAVGSEEITSDRVVVDSIRRFKGLERPVVLLVLDSVSGGNEELLYTAITRAQVILEILAPPHVIHRIKNMDI